MTEISEAGIHRDIIRINRIRVRSHVSETLCSAFIASVEQDGQTLQDVADRLDVSVDTVVNYLTVANKGLDTIADLTLAMGVNIRFSVSSMNIEPTVDEMRMNYEGAMSDLDSALDVLISRINGEKDMESAAEWIRLNYPSKSSAIITV